MNATEARYIKPKSATNFFNDTVARLTRMGISVYGSRVLYVKGPQVRRVAHHPGQPADPGRRHAVPGRPARQHPVGPQPARRRHRRAAHRPEGRAVHRDGDRRRRQARDPARLPEALEVRGRRVLRRRGRQGPGGEAARDRPRLPDLPHRAGQERARTRRSRRPACPSARPASRRRPAGTAPPCTSAAISRAPRSNGTTARHPGTTDFTFELSNTMECVLSPSSPAPHSGSCAAITSDGTCTSRGVTPSAAPSA